MQVWADPALLGVQVLVGEAVSSQVGGGRGENPRELTDESTSFKCSYLHNDEVVIRNSAQINIFSPLLTQQEVLDKISKVLSD